MSHKIINDPKKFGPGMWTSIHILAYNSKAKVDQLIYCKTIRILCSNLPCHTCRSHAIEFIENYPPEKVVSDKDEKAMFKWSCDLHNNANKEKRPSSPVVNWELFYNEYEINAPKDEEIVNFVEERTPLQGVRIDIYNRIMSKSNVLKK